MNGFCNQAARHVVDKQRCPIGILDDEKVNLGNAIGDELDLLFAAEDIEDAAIQLAKLTTVPILYAIKHGINLDPILEILLEAKRHDWDDAQIKARVDYTLRNQTVDGSFH